ncbi:AMIN-like domain-containing (lipo)protein [Cellulosimicrobium marinum]|uniref:AMIN-like domain-containing (lipo)protein n=1 Tax=Cellulosimicrobium marinum TaxID=1638992 RepID=UPI001E625219|nr:hypothetical protein [Cellulosimicrobium marinum]MCB7137929.1 hypothetical protein [Cellulosimicrobium marinum]
MDTRRTNRTARGVAAATLALTLAACTAGGGDDDPTDASSTTASPSGTGTPTSGESPTDDSTDDPSDDATGDPTDEPSTPADEADDAPVPFPANTDPDTQDPSADAMLTVTDVRVGHHDGYDRVVLELGGTGAPGWRVEYVDEPRDDGSGNAVDVDGDAYLQVMISGSGYPFDTGVEEFDTSTPVPGPEDGEIEEVLLRGVFEGYTQAFVGVDDERRPFRAFALEDPARVVVDVRDDG